MRYRLSPLLLSLGAACTATEPELGVVREPVLTVVGEQKLLSQPLVSGDNLGRAAAASGDTVLFGSPLADRGATSDVGAVYAFTRSGGSFAQQAVLTASDGLSGDQLGQSVAIDGNLAAVGAHLADLPGKVNAGAAYVFLRSGATFQQEAKLTASDGAADDAFGYSIAISGSTAIVGAYLADQPGKSNAGAAYVFVRSGTQWTQQAKLTASDSAMGDEFGSAVALSGDTAVVTAFLADLPGKTDAGAAYVFQRSGATWGTPQKLVAPDAAFDDRLGLSAASLRDTIVLGSPRADRPGLTDVGAVYVYTAGATGYGAPLKLTASDGAASDALGRSVAVLSDAVFAGASAADPMALLNAGAGYAFTVRRSTGDSCTAPTDCTSGFCVGSVCCESACTGGTCKDGVCTPAPPDLATSSPSADFATPTMEPTSFEGGCGCHVGGSAGSLPLGAGASLLLLGIGLLPLRKRLRRGSQAKSAASATALPT